MATAKQIEIAVVKMESAACELLRHATALQSDSAWWQRRDLLTAAREYARAVSRVTRVRSSR